MALPHVMLSFICTGPAQADEMCGPDRNCFAWHVQTLEAGWACGSWMIDALKERRRVWTPNSLLNLPMC